MDLKQSEMDYIIQQRSPVGVHILSLLNEMRVKRKELLECLQEILSSTLPTVLLYMILDYEIII